MTETLDSPSRCGVKVKTLESLGLSFYADDTDGITLLRCDKNNTLLVFVLRDKNNTSSGVWSIPCSAGVLEYQFTMGVPSNG